MTTNATAGRVGAAAGRAPRILSPLELIVNQTDPTAETARALLWRHGLPEDVIDGALCLHAQELAGLQRLRMDELDLVGQKARIVGRIVDLIDPTKGAAVSAVVAPPTDRAARRKRYAAAMDAVTGGICPTDLIDAVMAVADEELRRLAAEAHDAGTQQQPDTEAWRCDAGFVFGGRCVKPAGHRDPHVTAPVAQQPAAPKLPPMDPVHILGIYADGDQQPAADGLTPVGGVKGNPFDYHPEDEQQAAAADDEETRFVLFCNRAHTLHEHTPHDWAPKPGMGPVHCPGYGNA